MALLPIFAVNPTLVQMESINASVVGYWRLDGDVTDETTTGSHLTEESAASFSAAHPSQALVGGHIGGNLAASDRRYWRTSIDSSLQINGDITISMIINLHRIHAAPEASELNLVELNDETSGLGAIGNDVTNRYAVVIDSESVVKVVFSTGSSTQDFVDFDRQIRTQVGVPHHLVIRRSGTSLEVYLNGVLAGSSTLTAATGNGTGTVLGVGRNVSTANHTVAMASLCIWDTALTAQNISDLYDLHLFDLPTEFTVSRVAMGGGLDIDFAAAEVFTKDPSGAATTFTISSPLLHRTRTIEIIDTTGGGDINVPGTVTWVSGESPADVDADVLVINRRYILQLYCDDEITPHYWGSFRKEV